RFPAGPGAAPPLATDGPCRARHGCLKSPSLARSPYSRPEMELVLVRHAEPVRVEGGDVPADPHLTPRGREQAARLAAWLAHEPIDHLVTSPLVRARETVAPVAAATGLAP